MMGAEGRKGLGEGQRRQRVGLAEWSCWPARSCQNARGGRLPAFPVILPNGIEAKPWVDRRRPLGIFTQSGRAEVSGAV